MVLEVILGEFDDSVGRGVRSLSEFVESLLALVVGKGDRTENKKD